MPSRHAQPPLLPGVPGYAVDPNVPDVAASVPARERLPPELSVDVALGVCAACDPPPVITAVLVSGDALVVHVAQAIVPDPVIVPPVIGPVVAILVTVPVVVESVPLVGRVTLVGPVDVKVMALAPEVVRLPPLAAVAHVGQAIVPVDVMGPPLIGPEVPTEVTVPVVVESVPPGMMVV